ncbi:MAG: hypothetical protein VW988_02445 [Gammaproteobacteria bacterium]
MRIFLLLTIFFAFASITSLDANEINQETSAKIIKQAETSYKKVLKVKNAWRDTNKIIKQAKKAHKAKDYEKSVMLAKKALNEANMAYEQYDKQKNKYRFLD